MQIGKEKKRYLKEIGKLLPVSRKEKKKFLAEFQEAIANYEAEVGVEADYARLVTYFGTPAAIAQEYTVAWSREIHATIAKKYKPIPLLYLLFGLLVLICAIWLSYNLIRAFLIYVSDYQFLSFH